MIMEIRSPLETHVEQMDTISSSNSQAHDLPKEMVGWNARFKPSIGGLEQH
jgi:hypothetical protein